MSNSQKNGKTRVNGDYKKLYNVNVGVLGHVDSGKTSLVQQLQETASTAANDKDPQSRQRGITLDVGFSSFVAPLPPHLAGLPHDNMQITLVDCPGHAQLIRTILGGSHIVDMVVLVIDITKGIETQTAECLVIAEICCSVLVVALNKVDLLPPETRAKQVAATKKYLEQTFNTTRFKGCKIVPVAAKPGDGSQSVDIHKLKQRLCMLVPPPKPFVPGKALLFAIDHCFGLKGQGTVMTGTVLQGEMCVGDMVEVCGTGQQRKVKQIQVFKVNVNKVVTGDRAAINLLQIDSKQIERGLVATPGSVPRFEAGVVQVEKVRYYVGDLCSGAKIHIQIGHYNAMGALYFFGHRNHNESGVSRLLLTCPTDLHTFNCSNSQVSSSQACVHPFNLSASYVQQAKLSGREGRKQAQYKGNLGNHDSQVPAEEERYHGPQWAVIVLDKVISAPMPSIVVGAKLDSELSSQSCRLAVHGVLVHTFSSQEATEWRQQHLYKVKFRKGIVDRVCDGGFVCICRSMFCKDGNLAPFMGMWITFPFIPDLRGTVLGPFGKSGKFRVQLSRQCSSSIVNQAILLEYKRFMSDKMRQ